VQLAAEATVVFNMIDVGENFDFAVQALCIKKRLLLIQGGNFCQQFNVDSILPGQACLLCSTMTGANQDLLRKILPSKIEAVTDLQWLPRDVNPISQSNVYLCLLTC
jgi:hypothetical protein